MSELGFEPQISGFTHRRLNQLVHRDTYTNSETNLSTSVVQWLSYSPLDPRFAGSIPAGLDEFSERKNPEYDFLRKGSKAVGPVS